jgi:hypothetical protein
MTLRLALALLLCGSALSASAQDATARPLTTLSEADLRPVSSLLPDGVVALVTHSLMPEIRMATEVAAPVDVVADVVGTPEDYPRFMPAVSEVALTDRAGAAQGFRWRFATAVFAFGGRAYLTRFDGADPSQGVRFELRRTDGDLGQGREVWRILPAGPGRSLVVMTTRTDLRGANYLTDRVGSASINRSINIALGVGTLLRTRQEAERRAGRTTPHAALPFTRPRLDAVRLTGPLAHADLVFVEASDDGQTAVLSTFPQPEDRVRAIMRSPEDFAQALVRGSTATVTRTDAEGTFFDWRVDLPLIGTGGAMRLTEAGRQVRLDATQGALSGGRWRFESYRLPARGTAVLGWAHFDVADANFMLRAIVDADAAFRPGLAAAMDIMMVRALRIRLRRAG